MSDAFEQWLEQCIKDGEQISLEAKNDIQYEAGEEQSHACQFFLNKYREIKGQEQSDYEELAAGVGELRQIINYMLVTYGVTRNEFALWGFDAEIFDAIVREFGSE